ncbi:hypothetical protein Sango_2919200 [Sesamum angolense]|uniref:Subtilisin-like protease fibronectin type-III domain-containing protein n=1 Tax=Sesamum angolense TaxID=2727404 RepID=A0AAE1T4U5_9LAMI|nr:hypothetical protein Sango_2919200 [Sesamum angolense]
MRAITRSPYSCSNPSIHLNYPSFIAFFSGNGTKTVEFQRTLTNVGSQKSSYLVNLESIQGFKVRVVPERLVFRHKHQKQGYTLKIEGPYSGMVPANITASINTIPMLNGSNFKSWKENLEIVLGVIDFDLALWEDSPPTLTDKSTSEQKREKERWEKSNPKDFLEHIEKRFVKNEKAEIDILLTSLISKRYTGKGNIREFNMEMSHLTLKLKALKLDLSEDLLVHLVLISLPTQFSQFKVSYNCQKEAWSLNDLISHCVQEEERLKQD